MGETRERAWRATHKNCLMSGYKARLVADQIRGKDVDEAQTALRFSAKRAAYFIDRVLRSAVANADQEGDVDVERLYVAEARVDEGSTRMRKRWRAGPHGRAMRYKKRTCPLTVVVRERSS